MPIHSMTAYANQAQSNAEIQWTWEMKSVNHRYLDIQIKLPEPFRSLEPKLRERVKNTLRRGKVDIALQYAPNADSSGVMNINTQALDGLFSTVKQIKNKAPSDIHFAKISLSELLKWPGIVKTEDMLNEQQELELINSFESTLSKLKAERAREGQALKKAMAERLPTMVKIAETLKQAVPEMIEQQHQKFTQRISAFEPEIQAERLAQELVLFAQKIDIAEELDRLIVHVDEVENLLESDSAVGKQLDFMLQELNREANTIGSKASQIKTSQSAVDLKVLIEQLREQVQNIE